MNIKSDCLELDVFCTVLCNVCKEQWKGKNRWPSSTLPLRRHPYPIQPLAYHPPQPLSYHSPAFQFPIGHPWPFLHPSFTLPIALPHPSHTLLTPFSCLHVPANSEVSLVLFVTLFSFVSYVRTNYDPSHTLPISSPTLPLPFPNYTPSFSTPFPHATHSLLNSFHTLPSPFLHSLGVCWRGGHHYRGPLFSYTHRGC